MHIKALGDRAPHGPPDPIAGFKGAASRQGKTGKGGRAEWGR